MSRRGPAGPPGTVVAVHHEKCPGGEQPDAPGGGPTECGSVEVLVTSGGNRGETVTTAVPDGPGAPEVSAGDQVTLGREAAGAPYQIRDHQRGLQLWLVVAVFALAVIGYGRLRGLRSLAGLAVTFGVLLLFIVPAILAGQPPLLVAIVGSAVIMLTVLYLTHGFSIETSVALFGTLGSLVLTGVLAAIATSLTHLSGVADEDTFYLTLSYGDVDMRGLLLAGILIGCLGVLDDVAITQATTVTELARANPGYSVQQLYHSATRVGRSHIASVVNTIVLAYAGASLPLLVLIAASDHPLGQTLTNPLIAQEIVRSAVGTVGLVATVPITTLLAALATHHFRQAASEWPEPGPADPANRW